MVEQALTQDESDASSLQVEAVRTALNEDVASGRSYAGLGVAALMFFALSSCALLRLCSSASVNKSSFVPEIGTITKEDPMFAPVLPVRAPGSGHARLTNLRRSHPAVLPNMKRTRLNLQGKAAGISMSGAADLDVKEYIKIFGRLGEKMLFGDESAGLCCHSACDDCEWRYSFDIVQSARPKWIPSYKECKFKDGREHVSKWSALFGDDDKVDKAQFCERLQAMKFEMPLGPSGYLTAKQAELAPEAMDVFWDHISRGKPTLSAKQMGIRLRKMLQPGDENDGGGVMWTDFIDSFMTADSADGDLLDGSEDADSSVTSMIPIKVES